ncbi:MAG: bile acid:sodium symporter family protein [Gammaproteobacteria bacterium]|nr:bile acid:sodium symporter family protein [Gammaproteobacteria bacterium]
MNQDPVLAIALPLTLFCIMLSMGTTLQLADFRRVLGIPKIIMIGLISQMILLPLLVLAVIILLEIPFKLSPEIIVGFMILALSPGGTTSNLFSFMAGGRVALSITLTAVVSLLTPITIPLLGALVLQWQMGSSSDLSLPLIPTFMKLAVVTIIPVALGMVLRHRYPDFCLRNQNQITRVPMVMLLLVIGGIILTNIEQMPMLLEMTAIPALLIASLALAMGYSFARLSRSDRQDSHTVAIETGIQNGGTAILVTGTILHNPVMTIAPVMYGILMLIPTLIYIAWAKRR